MKKIQHSSYFNFLIEIIKNFKYLLIPFFIIFFIYVPLLRNEGEFYFSNDLAKLSIGNKQILWQSRFYDAGRHFKLKITKKLSPEVLVLGSSRVLQIRSKMFNKISAENFYNAGSSVSNIDEVVPINIHVLIFLFS